MTVDRLEEKADLRGLQLRGGILQVLDKHAAGLLRRDTARQESGETIELRTVERLSVFNGFAHAVVEFHNAVRLASYSPFAAAQSPAGRLWRTSSRPLSFRAPAMSRGENS